MVYGYSLDLRERIIVEAEATAQEHFWRPVVPQKCSCAMPRPMDLITNNLPEHRRSKGKMRAPANRGLMGDLDPRSPPR